MASDYVFPYMAAATGGAGSYVDSPWRIVLHTTETNSRPSAWIPNFKYPSHVVCSYEHNEIFQLIGLNEAGKALYHGGIETNRMGAIQIEINGYADDAGSWSQDKLKWLGEKVLKPICDWIDDNGGGFDCYNIPAPGAHGGSASADAPQRMTYAEWTDFNGICGHRHVPDNDHYDPDQLNVPQVVAYANAGEVEDMTPEDWARIDARFDTIQRQTEGTIWHLGDFMPTSGTEKARVADRVARILQIAERENSNHFAEVENLNLPLPNLLRLPKLLQSPEFIDAIAKAVVSAMPTDGSGGATEVDYDKIAAIVDAALKKLVLHAD